MKNAIKRTIGSFHKRGGTHIFFSTISLRVIQFVLGVMIIRLLTKEDYGNVSYAITITQLIIPFSGAGLFLSLLHFGSLQETFENKVHLLNFTIRRGFLYSLLLIAVILILSVVVSISMPGAVPYLRLFSLYVMAYFLFNTAVSFLRILKKNKTYAASMILNSVIVFLLSITGVFIAKGFGYVLGFSLAPILSAIIILLTLRKKENVKLSIFAGIDRIPVDKKKYVKYGVFAGLGNIASQMAWQLDTIMIGILLSQSEIVATYKVAAFIPFSLVFIPGVFIQTDFVYIAEKYNDRKYIINYYKKYFMIFSLIVVLILSFWYTFNGKIVMLFGSEYLNALPLINILMINVATTFLFRVPLGNILAAVGKAKWNSTSAIIMLVLNLILNYFLIPQYGIRGAAYATVTSIAFSALINIVLFKKYLNEIKPITLEK